MENFWQASTWLTLNEAASFARVEAKKIRTWVRDGQLLALHHPEDSKLRVSQDFFCPQGDSKAPKAPLDSLAGTLTLLRDGGFTDSQAAQWLFSADDFLGGTPVQALQRGAKKKVRQLAGAAAI